MPKRPWQFIRYYAHAKIDIEFVGKLNGDLLIPPPHNILILLPLKNVIIVTLIDNQFIQHLDV